MNSILKSRLFKIAQIAVVLLSFGFIYREIFVTHNISDFTKTVSDNHIYAILAVLLLIANLGLESLKWHRLVNKVEPFSIYKTIISILTGNTISVFTPNRVGEFGGKIMFVSKGHRLSAFVLAVAGNFSQLLMTLFFGTFGLLYFLFYYSFSVDRVTIYGWYILFFVTILALITLYWLYLKPGIACRMFSKNKLFLKAGDKIDVLTSMSSKFLFKISLISGLRYMVFITQYWLLLRYFDINLPYFQSLMLISLVYLIMTVVPTVALADIGVRSTVAVWVLGMLSTNSLGIIGASFFLWIINIAFPALLGSVFVLKAHLDR